MTRDELIWAAGIMDGEGHIRATKNLKKHYYARIHIAMVHQKTVERMLAIFGKGKIKPQKPKRGRPAGRWECNGDDAIQVLLVLRQFLYTKSEECNIVTELSTPGNRLSAEEREAKWKRLRFLNGRYNPDNEDEGGEAVS